MAFGRLLFTVVNSNSIERINLHGEQMLTAGGAGGLLYTDSKGTDRRNPMVKNYSMRPENHEKGETYCEKEFKEGS